LSTGDGVDTTNIQVGSSDVLSAGIWYNVIFTLEYASGNSTAKIYINGSEVKSGILSRDVSNNSENVKMGGQTDFFDGCLSDVRIYDEVVLSAAEALSIYNETDYSSPIQNGKLVSRWKLDETSGTTAEDSIGSHDGTLTNFPTPPTWTATGPSPLSYMTLYVDTTNTSNYPPTANLVCLATSSVPSTPLSLSLKIVPFSQSLAYNTALTIHSASSTSSVTYGLKAFRAETEAIDAVSIAYQNSSFATAVDVDSDSVNGYNETIAWSSPSSWSFGSGSFFNRTAGPGEENKWSYLTSYNDATCQGTINNFRIWRRILNDNELAHHTLNYRSIATDTGIDSLGELVCDFEFDENIAADTNGDISVLNSSYLGSSGGVSATGSGFTAATNPYRAYDSEILSIFPYFNDPDYGVENIRTFEAKTNTGLTASNKYGVAFEANLCDELSRDQADVLFNFDTLNNILGKNPGRTVTEPTYPGLENLRKIYFQKRWAPDRTLMLNEYNQAMKYLALNIHHVMTKLIPVRAHYAGSFFTVEPHLLERQRILRDQPSISITPPAGVTQVLSSSFADLNPVMPTGLPAELKATRDLIKTIGVLPLQDPPLRDTVAAYDLFTNTVNSIKEYSYDVDLGAIRKTKVRQSSNSSPKVITTYLQPINPFNTDVAGGESINYTGIGFNTGDSPSPTDSGIWEDASEEL